MSRSRRTIEVAEEVAPAHLEMRATFGRRVRELRTARGWSGERLAQESSLTSSAVSHIERAISEPLLSTVLLLIETLEVSPAELLTGIPAPRVKRVPFTGRTG